MQNPPAAHLVVTDANYTHWKEFAPIVQACYEEVINDPKLNNSGDAAMYGIASSVPDKSIISDALTLIIEEVLEI